MNFNNKQVDEDLEILDEALDGLDTLYEDEFEFENTYKMRRRMRMRNFLIAFGFFVVLTTIIGFTMMGIYAKGNPVYVNNEYIARREYYDSISEEYIKMKGFIVEVEGTYSGSLYSDILDTNSTSVRTSNYNAVVDRLSAFIENQDFYNKKITKIKDSNYKSFNVTFFNTIKTTLEKLSVLDEQNWDASNKSFMTEVNSFASYYVNNMNELNGFYILMTKGL